jgi:hypothetical protein
VAEENKAGLKADQVLVVLLKHLAELAWFALEAVSHKKSALPLVLQFPFVLDLSRSTFELLHGLMAASKAQLLVAHEVRAPPLAPPSASLPPPPPALVFSRWLVWFVGWWRPTP